MSGFGGTTRSGGTGDGGTGPAATTLACGAGKGSPAASRRMAAISTGDDTRGARRALGFGFVEGFFFFMRGERG